MIIKEKKIKIVDSFLFSEIYEKELLLLKFILESPHIDEWIVLENAYSFQGDFIGLHSEMLINSDEKFAPFRSRITFITREVKPELLNKNEVLDEKAFKVEFWQRNLAQNYFLNKYHEEDWIIISDVDEALDLTDSVRYNELFERLNIDKQGVLHVSTKRFWFDFDNEYKILYGLPMCTKKYLLSTGKKLHDVRMEYHTELKMDWNNIIGFEYSSCFDIEHIMRKLETGSHMGFSKDDLKKAMFCNHRVVSEKRNRELKPSEKFYLETINLTSKNSPTYVRENLETLKTNNIHKNYKENRKVTYPYFYSPFFSFNEWIDKKKKVLTEKFRFLMRRLGLEKSIYK